MNLAPEQRGTERLAAAALLTCAAVALANLPAQDFSPGWLAALVVPGLLLGRLPPATSHWRRALLTSGLQVFHDDVHRHRKGRTCNAPNHSVMPLPEEGS